MAPAVTISARLVRVDRPEVKLVQPEVAGQIAERALAADQPAAILGQRGQPFAHRADGGGQFGPIGLGIRGKGGRIRRIDSDQRAFDVGHVDQRVVQAHPGMRVRAALLPCDRNRDDALGQRGGGHVAEVGQELLEPALEVEAVPQHEIGARRRDDVLRRRLIAVDLGARLGDRDDVDPIARHIARHVGDDDEGGDDFQPLLGQGRQRHKGKGGGQEQDSARQQHGAMPESW